MCAREIAREARQRRYTAVAAAVRAADLPPARRVPPTLLPLARAAGNVSIRFKLPYRCKYGQELCITGEDDVLGGWTVERAIPMVWTEGDVWQVELQLPTK